MYLYVTARYDNIVDFRNQVLTVRTYTRHYVLNTSQAFGFVIELPKGCVHV